VNSGLPEAPRSVEDTNERGGTAHRDRGTRGRLRRRLLVTFLAVISLLIAGFYLGGGWYFSGQIHEDGLRVDNGPQDTTLRVVRARNELPGCLRAPGAPDVGLRVTVACSVVTLRETGADQPALREPLVYGLDWGSGYGQVYGAPEAGRGGGVQRHVLVLEGAPPQRGDEARLDRSSFPASPSLAVDRLVRNVQYTSPAGSFSAWYVPGEAETWTVLVHGYRSSRTEVLRAMAVTADMGLPTLAISYRNDKGVPRDESGLYRFGETEWQELEGAVQYALDQGAADVKLVANSMGGAITASFLRRSPLAPRVSGVVLDSPMLDFGATVSHGASQRSLPVLGSIPASLVGTAKLLASARYGVDWDAIDYLDDTSWVKVPTLVLHGTADLRVPLSTSQELAEAEPELVRLRTFPGAEHVGAWNQEPELYAQVVRDFLR
jgi:uncharacterized protein